jgi:hypothetical protein
MNIIIERAHCAVGLKIEIPNEGTIRIDCSEVAKNYNPTVIRMKGQIYTAEKAAAEKARQEFIISPSQSDQTTVPPDPDPETSIVDPT